MDEGIVIVFRSRLRAEHTDEYQVWGERMHTLATAQPGFRSMKSFVAEDGERLTLVEFDSDADVRAWRAHPEHAEAQRLGRLRFYSEYELTTCVPLRRTRWP